MNRLVEEELNRMEEENEKRMNVIAQNGNEGLHYVHYDLDGEITEIEVNEPIVVEPTSKAKLRKATPVFSGVLKYFPDALREVARCSKVGNDQHNPDKELFWDRSKSGDELDALTRHLLEAGTFDTDGIRHSTKVAWRSLANLQKEIEAENNNH